VEIPAFIGDMNAATSDSSPGGDMGVARFIFEGRYADPRDVSELSKFMLTLDPELETSPGGL
jgi:hypothetical protein